MAIWMAVAAEAQTTFHASFAFAPLVTNLAALDHELEGYGFAPVGSPFLPSWGIHARATFPSGVLVGASMASSFASNRVEGVAAPTTTTWTRLGWFAGALVADRVTTELELGFGSLTQTVGSDVGGGALVYLGPTVHPRVGLLILEAPQHLEVQVGWLAEVPIGPAHRQPLWDEPFRRPVIHGASLALVTGLGVKR
jgi:hypothetical protein